MWGRCLLFFFFLKFSDLNFGYKGRYFSPKTQRQYVGTIWKIFDQILFVSLLKGCIGVGQGGGRKSKIGVRREKRKDARKEEKSCAVTGRFDPIFLSFDLRADISYKKFYSLGGVGGRCTIPSLPHPVLRQSHPKNC